MNLPYRNPPLGIEVRSVDPETDDTAKMADVFSAIGYSAYGELVAEYPTGLTQEDVDRYFLKSPQSEDPPKAHSRFVSEMEGTALNRSGKRKSKTYVATFGAYTCNEIVGWLTAAVDYGSRIKAPLKSYLWLVNCAVDPRWQNKGVMSELLRHALNDQDKPEVNSANRRVSAYPIVAQPIDGEPSEILLPAERLLLRAGVNPTDPPEGNVEIIGAKAHIRRYEGGSPESVVGMIY